MLLFLLFGFSRRSGLAALPGSLGDGAPHGRAPPPSLPLGQDAHPYRPAPLAADPVLRSSPLGPSSSPLQAIQHGTNGLPPAPAGTSTGAPITPMSSRNGVVACRRVSCQPECEPRWLTTVRRGFGR